MSDSSSDYKLSLELRAKDWRRQRENVPECVGFSTQCLLFKNCFHYSGIKQCGTQEENILMLLILRSPAVHDGMGGRESLCFSGNSSGSTAAWGLSGQGKRRRQRVRPTPGQWVFPHPGVWTSTPCHLLSARSALSFTLQGSRRTLRWCFTLQNWQGEFLKTNSTHAHRHLPHQ